MSFSETVLEMKKPVKNFVRRPIFWLAQKPMAVMLQNFRNCSMHSSMVLDQCMRTGPADKVCLIERQPHKLLLEAETKRVLNDDNAIT